MIELFISLAIFKLTLLFMDFNGPLDIIFYFRKYTEKVLKFDCFFCLSTVIALPFALVYQPHNFITYWFGFAGAALIINAIYEYV